MFGAILWLGEDVKADEGLAQLFWKVATIVRMEFTTALTLALSPGERETQRTSSVNLRVLPGIAAAESFAERTPRQLAAIA
jgi:hypothetical protein